jgi:hypothetical protein
MTLVAMIEDEGHSQSQRLQQMKDEFLAARQRRRETPLDAAARRDNTDDGVAIAVPGGDTSTRIAAVRPLPSQG